MFVWKEASKEKTKDKNSFFSKPCISKYFTTTNKDICCLYEACPHTFFQCCLEPSKNCSSSFLRLFFFFNFWKCLQWLCDCTISICWKLALKVSFDCAEIITKAQKLYPETVLVGLDRSVCGFRQHFPLDMKYYLGPLWIYWVQTTLNLYSFASTGKHLPGTGQRTYKSVSYLQT